MDMHSLFAAGLIALLSLSNISAAKPPSYDCSFAGTSWASEESPGRTVPPNDETPISLDEYWDLVRDTRQSITQMEAKSGTAVRSELNALAAQWEQALSVELSDHSLILIDSSHLVTELRRDPPDLKRLGKLLDALLHAHEQYPQKVFTVEDVAPLNEILARPEFQWQQAQATQWPDWLVKLGEWLTRFRNRILNATFQYGRVPLIIAAALLFAFSLFFISRSLSRSLVRESQLVAEENDSDELLTSKGAFKRAETLSTQGDYRNAIRYLYLSSLLVLDEQGLMRYDRSRTNREYLRSVSSKPELAKPLHDVIDVFDRVWYGFEGVDKQTYQSYVERVDELREKKE